MILRTELVEQWVDTQRKATLEKDVLMTQGLPLGMLRKHRPNGAPTKGAVILIHGFAQNRYTWHTSARSFSAYLADEGWDVFVAELRGHGRSRHYSHLRPRTLDDHVREDFPAFVREAVALSGHESVTLIGHSMGGLLSYASASTSVRERVSGVITLGSPYRFGAGNFAMKALGKLVEAVHYTGLLDGRPMLPTHLAGKIIKLARPFHDARAFPLPLRGYHPRLDRAGAARRIPRSLVRGGERPRHGGPHVRRRAAHRRRPHRTARLRGRVPLARRAAAGDRRRVRHARAAGRLPSRVRRLGFERQDLPRLPARTRRPRARHDSPGDHMAADPRLARETPVLKPKEVLAVAGDDIPPWLRKLVHVMDDAIPIPGTNQAVGLDAILGAILPGAGDALTGLTTLALLYVAVKRGVPGAVLFKMVGQQLIDFGLGSVPVVGDVFDVLNRANKKNLELIESHARGTAELTASDRLFIALAVMIAIGLVVLPFVVAGAVVAALVKLVRG